MKLYDLSDDEIIELVLEQHPEIFDDNYPDVKTVIINAKDNWGTYSFEVVLKDYFDEFN